MFPLMEVFQVTCMDAVMICVHWHSFSEVFVRQCSDFISRILSESDAMLRKSQNSGTNQFSEYFIGE